MDLATDALIVYYNTIDGVVYAYINDMLSDFIADEFGMTVPSGWYPFVNFTGLLGMNYYGVVMSMDDAVQPNTFYIVISSILFSYNGQWELLKEERVQSDWDQTDDTQPDYIWNKPNMAQADWDIADESNPAAIKNKPFGMVEQIVDIVPETSYYFQSIGSQNQIGNVGQNIPFQNDTIYQVWFNGEYIGTARPEEHINIPNGTFVFVTGGFIISGGNYPEGNYSVRIAGPQIITKKLDSQYLNLCTNVYDPTTRENPITGEVVFNITADYGMWQSNLNNKIDNIIMPAIGPVPIRADENKVLQVVDGKPTWAEVSGGDDTKVLVVTAEWDEENEYHKASHTPKQIYDHVQSGGVAVLSYDTSLYNLWIVGEEWASFWTLGDDLVYYLLEFNDSCECSFSDQQLTSWQNVNDELMRVITVDENDVPSMTSQQIYHHVRGGGRVVLNYNGQTYSLASCGLNSAYFNYYDETYEMHCVEIHNNNISDYEFFRPASAEWVHKQLDSINEALDDLKNKVLPTITTADNGKLLQVVDGAWTAVSITNGNEVAY